MSLHPSDLVTSSRADAAYSSLDGCQHSHKTHTSHTRLVTKIKVRINRKKNTILNLGSWLEQIRTALEQLQHLERGGPYIYSVE